MVAFKSRRSSLRKRCESFRTNTNNKNTVSFDAVWKPRRVRGPHLALKPPSPSLKGWKLGESSQGNRMSPCVLFIYLFISRSPEIWQVRFHAMSRLISRRGTGRLPVSMEVRFLWMTVAKRKEGRGQPSVKTCQESSLTARPWPRHAANRHEVVE